MTYMWDFFYTYTLPLPTEDTAKLRIKFDIHKYFLKL